MLTIDAKTPKEIISYDKWTVTTFMVAGGGENNRYLTFSTTRCGYNSNKELVLSRDPNDTIGKHISNIEAKAASDDELKAMLELMEKLVVKYGELS